MQYGERIFILPLAGYNFLVTWLPYRKGIPAANTSAPELSFGAGAKS
jgi:hypothetical protein